MEQIGDLVMFVQAAQQLSFSVAARQLGLSPSSVSRAVQRLEERLKARLFNRSTRSIALTEDGSVFYDYCRQILSDLEEAELVLSQSRSHPRGTLRIGLTVALGRLYITPALPHFTAQYPDLNLDITLGDRRADLIEEGIDAVVRVGHTPDSRLVIRPLAIARFFVCATPAYLARHGEPQTLADLQHHNCLNLVLPQTGRVRDWVFQHKGQELHLAVDGNFRCDHAEALLEAALAHAGLIQLYNFLVNPAIIRGELKPVLESYTVPGFPISVLYPHKRHLSAKVHVFVEFMTELMEGLKRDRIVE
ncbi:LysR family transcriptional regulator [Leptolyngbya sp. FACHB-261]|nr:LysR family transcriptional regulator [Leptolyngbya sp. FACHB-261]